MSNVREVKRNTVELMLDKPRTLKYTLNSFAEMEEKYGSVEAALDAVSSNKVTAIRFMLWAGLIHEDDDLTEKEVGNLIAASDLPMLCEKLMEAFEGDAPTQKQIDNANATVTKTNPNA